MDKLCGIYKGVEEQLPEATCTKIFQACLTVGNYSKVTKYGEMLVKIMEKKWSEQIEEELPKRKSLEIKLNRYVLAKQFCLNGQEKMLIQRQEDVFCGPQKKELSEAAKKRAEEKIRVYWKVFSACFEAQLFSESIIYADKWLEAMAQDNRIPKDVDYDFIATAYSRAAYLGTL